MAYFKPQKGTRSTKYFVKASFVLFVLFCGISVARADDGYRLWLRYEKLPSADRYRQSIQSIAVQGKSATFDAIRRELSVGCAGLLGTPIVVGDRDEASVIVGTPETSGFIHRLGWDAELKNLGLEGYRIRTIRSGKVVIASTTDVGALYGTFHFLRLLQTEQPLARLQLDQSPRLKLRILNHWDNLDGSIERGYAGKSLWNWSELPAHIDPRLTDYARANASIGINGSVLNNVNANAQILTAEYLEKVAAIAKVFRPYGIRVYLAARFSATMEIGKLDTADPLDRSVIAWW